MHRIRRLRKDRGLTIRELATKSGVAFQTLQRVESGRQVPSPPTRRKILKGLGLTMESRHLFELGEDDGTARA